MRTKEYQLIQNVVLASLALRSFAKGFATNGGAGPSYLRFLPVLPIVFHEESVDNLHRRRFLGGLDNAMIDDRSIFTGLQKRMEDMYEQTRSGLFFACASRLLSYDVDSKEFFPTPRARSPAIRTEETRRILATAERLGHWSAYLPIAGLTQKLSVQF